MKTLRSWWFVLLVLAACATDSEAPSGSPLGGPCTGASSVTRGELEAGGMLCEHQTLVAPIRPGDDLELAFRVLTPGDVDLCFDDDDDEPHEVSLRGHVVTAEKPCQTVSLPAGDHMLGVRHFMRDAGGEDPAPDVVHTKWTPPTSASRGRLQVMTNACPGCTLNGPWPALDDHTAGYVGDYTGAIIHGTCAQPHHNSHCVLGGLGIRSSFDRANVVFTPNVAPEAVVAFTIIGDSNQGAISTTFREATLELRGILVVYATDASHATFSSAGGGNIGLEIYGSKLESIDTTAYRDPSYVIVKTSVLDAVTFSALLSRGEDARIIRDVTVAVSKDHSLAGLTIDGAPAQSSGITIEWPLDGDRHLAMAGASFDKATLRHLSFGCLRGGDLEGASFVGATLDNVSLTGCKLTRAHFTGATLTAVTAAKGTSLTGADLSNVTIAGLDVTGASLSNVTLSNAPNKPAIGLVARSVTAGALDATDLVTGLDASGRGADFAFANLENARFTRAQLPRARFDGASLTSARFSDASLVGASFDAAFGLAPVFERANFDSSTAPRTSMIAARFVSPVFRAATLHGMKLTASRVCGGDFGGANLIGADLSGTPMPLVSDRFTIGAETFECPQLENLDTVVQDATTGCPNGDLGPCTGGAWLPTNLTPMCPPNTPRKVSGSPCSTACDCKLLTCIGGSCG